MNIELQPETIGILQDDYKLKSKQINYIKKYIQSYQEIPQEYMDSTILICGDAYAEALNYNEYYKEEIKNKVEKRMSITNNMDKNIKRYFKELNMEAPIKVK